MLWFYTLVFLRASCTATDWLLPAAPVIFCSVSSNLWTEAEPNNTKTDNKTVVITTNLLIPKSGFWIVCLHSQNDILSSQTSYSSLWYSSLLTTFSLSVYHRNSNPWGCILFKILSPLGRADPRSSFPDGRSSSWPIFLEKLHRNEENTADGGRGDSCIPCPPSNKNCQC